MRGNCIVDTQARDDKFLEALGTFKQGGASSLVDSRAFNKLSKFGSAREDWKDWSPVFLSFVASSVASLKAELDSAAEAELFNVGLDPVIAESSSQLHYMLLQLTSGTALDVMLNSGQGEGVEAWRRLVSEYDLRGDLQTRGPMMELLKFPFAADAASFK